MKLYDFISFLDKRANIYFTVNSFEKFVLYQGTVFDFLKSHFYQIYSCDVVSSVKVTGEGASKVLNIVVNTACE